MENKNVKRKGSQGILLLQTEMRNLEGRIFKSVMDLILLGTFTDPNFLYVLYLQIM
jgi:hypothetical protein